MIMLLFAVLLSLAAPAAAQSTLQLPDVTLFGEYTLYLAAPAPLSPEIPAATGMSDSRLSYPRSMFKVNLAEPRPPLFYWQRIPRSVLAPPGLLPDWDGNGAPQYTGEGQPAASGSWQARVDYIPGETVISELTATRSSGVWDLSAMLDFNLADGWVTSPPDFPTDLTFWVQSRRRAQALNVDAALGGGAFYDAGSAADGSAVYSLGLVAGLYGEAGALQWREETQLSGISGIGGGSPPVDPDKQRGAVQQELELSLIGSRWDLSLRSGGVLAAGLPSADAEEHARTSLELGWHHPSSILRLWAGGAALYYDESLTFFPSGGLEFYPTDFFSLSLHAAPFVRLPPQRSLQILCAVQAVSANSAIAHLQSEGGYSLYSELRFDPGAIFAAALSFEWINGQIYLLDASDREMSFTDTNQGVIQGDLIWQLRAGEPGIRLNLTGEVAAAFPLPAAPWQELLYSRAGVVWTTDFHKLPVEFIIKALIGDFADDGSRAFLFTDWEIISSLVTSIEGNWKIGKNGAVHTGFEAFLTPNFSFRFLIGYGIRR
jgi:hypothetical protein